MFITFEGIDGAGKTSLARLVESALKAENIPTLLTREPGAGNLGQAIRSLVLDHGKSALSPNAELFLFMADRAQHIHEIIRPALLEGMTVLCDRYTLSTLAYQGYGRGLNMADLEFMNSAATSSLEPDITFLIDLPVNIALSRINERNIKTGEETRFDVEKISFHERIRQGYLELASRNQKSIIVLNGTLTLKELLFKCLQTISGTHPDKIKI